MDVVNPDKNKNKGTLVCLNLDTLQILNTEDNSVESRGLSGYANMEDITSCNTAGFKHSFIVGGKHLV